MVPSPAWLYYLLAVVMLAVAAYSVVLFAVSGPAHRRAGRDVEVSHVAMGLAMAGMFVPSWSFGPNLVWELVFAAMLVWFVARTAHSLWRYGPHVSHNTVHAVMSLAMLLMYRFPRGAREGAMAMTMGGEGARIDPGLAFVLTFVLFGSAIFTVASPNRGATHYGTHGELEGPVLGIPGRRARGGGRRWPPTWTTSWRCPACSMRATSSCAWPWASC